MFRSFWFALQRCPPLSKPYSAFSLVAQVVKHLPIMRETRVQSLGWEDLLEKEMAPHSRTEIHVLENQCIRKLQNEIRMGEGDFLENLNVMLRHFDLKQRKIKEKALDQESRFSCYCQ